MPPVHPPGYAPGVHYVKTWIPSPWLLAYVAAHAKLIVLKLYYCIHLHVCTILIMYITV